MAINDDPRERLVLAGQKLLDAEYKLALFHEEADALQAQYPDPENLSDDIMKQELPRVIHMVFESALAHAAFDQALAEYVLLRRTIEALDQPREPVMEDTQPMEQPPKDHPYGGYDSGRGHP